MGFIKRAYSNTRKIYIYGSGSILALFVFIQVYLGAYGVTATDWNGNQIPQILICAGNTVEVAGVQERCIWNITLKSSNYSVIFKNTMQIYMNDSSANYTLKKLDTLGRLRTFNMTGKTLTNESEWKLQVEIMKPIDRTVKWGINGVGLVSSEILDPIAKGYNPDDFFIRLVSNKADLGMGEAVFEIRNPLSVNIPIKSSYLTGRTMNILGSKVDRLEFYINTSVNVSQNVTDYSYTCSNITSVNGTVSEVCTNDITGWHWNNYTSFKWRPVQDFTFLKGETKQVMVKGYWKIGLGRVSNEWFPRLNVSNTLFEQGRWDWWNASWTSKVQINTSSFQANESIQINLSAVSGFAYGQVIADSCADIRVVNGTENGNIPYGFQIINCTSTDVEILWLQSASANPVAYIYWGNPSATVANITMRIYSDSFDTDTTSTYNKGDGNYGTWTWDSTNLFINLTPDANADILVRNTGDTDDKMAYVKMFTNNSNMDGTLYELVIQHNITTVGWSTAKKGIGSGFYHHNFAPYWSIFQNAYVNTGDYGVAPASNTWYNIKFWNIGTNASTKVWANGAPEPTTFNRSVTVDATTADRTWAGIGGINGYLLAGAQISWDNLEVWYANYSPTYYSTPATITLGSMQVPASCRVDFGIGTSLSFHPHSPIAKGVPADGQTDTIGILNLTNNGTTSASGFALKVNVTLPGWTMKCSNTSSYTNAISLTTSYQTAVNGTFAANAISQEWCWLDLFYPTQPYIFDFSCTAS